MDQLSCKLVNDVYILNLTDYLLLLLDSSISSPSATPWEKDQSLSSTPPKCSLLFSESKEWLGPFVLTTLSVRISNLKSTEILLTKSCVAGILSLTFPRMQTVMTPTGACKWILLDFPTGRFADLNSSRFLCWAQPYRLVYDLLFRQRD